MNPDPKYGPACSCKAFHDTSARFPIWRITEYDRECFHHGYMFNVNLAADLRYGD